MLEEKSSKVALQDTTIASGRSNGPNSPVIISFGEKIKGWVTNVLLAFCILALIANWVVWRNAGMVQDLKRYDLDNFKQTEWTELKIKVEVDHELIVAYGLQKVVQDTVNEALQEKANGRTHYHKRRHKRRVNRATGVGRAAGGDAREAASDLLQR
jgi:hypothetical protein